MEKQNADILAGLDRCIRLEERFLPKFPAGTSQHSLLKNRIRALYTARQLFSGELPPSKEDLEFSRPRIESILHKVSKARDKHDAGSRNYRRFDPTVQLMERVSAEIRRALEG